MLFFVGCAPKSGREITPQDIITAYENAGCEVRVSDDRDNPEIGYYAIQATKGKEFIYIYIYDSAEKAEAATKAQKWHIVLWIFTLPFGEYRWLKSKTYQNIHYEYFNREMAKPLKELMD
jgi:hypothetical protein